MNIIYEPKGAAKEYCDLALNIYTGCTNGCYYCYAPKVLHKSAEEFHERAEVRAAVTPEKVEQEIAKRGLYGAMIQLCFTCDPYPAGTDTSITREIIKAIHAFGCHVQILTKNASDAMRDFDLLTPHDKFGVTLTCTDPVKSREWEPHANEPAERIGALSIAHVKGIGTWVSFEPVVDDWETIQLISLVAHAKIADMVKIGKMNYFDTKRPIKWAEFGREAENICISSGQKYCIKNGLRREMDSDPHA